MAGNRAIEGKDVKKLLESCVNDARGDQGAGRQKFHRHLKECLEQKKLRPSDFSVKELFEALIPGASEEVSFWGSPRSRGKAALHPTGLLEAGGGVAVGFSDFSNITGQIFFTEILEKYMTPDFIYSAEVDHKPSSIPGIEKIAGLSRTGKGRKKVGEGEAYSRYGFSEDYIEVPEKVKDGGIVEVTREAVAFDLTGQLLDRCGEMGFDLGYNREERVIDALIDENEGASSAYAGGHQYTWKGTSYSTYASSGGWINLKTSNPLTVDETCVDAIWQLLVAITDPYTGRPIMNHPKVLMCTPQLAFKAARLLSTTEHRTTVPGYATSASPVQAVAPPALPKILGQLRILSTQILASRLGTDTSWFIGDPRKAVRVYYNWDITPMQRGAMTDAHFERDIVQQFRADLRDCVSTINPRYMGKSTA